MGALLQLLATLAALIPNAFMSVLGHVVTEKFMTRVIAKVTIHGLRWAASRTSNTVDDDLVEDVSKRLEGIA